MDLVMAAKNALETELVILRAIVAVVIIVVVLITEPELLEPPRKKRRIGKPGKAVKRRRPTVNAIMDGLGESYVRRSYRMKRETFWKLHDILWQKLRTPPTESKKKCRNGATNGVVTTSIRLSIAIRFFAGGDPNDISSVVLKIGKSRLINAQDDDDCSRSSGGTPACQ
jgi:hypothetical protein